MVMLTKKGYLVYLFDPRINENKIEHKQIERIETLQKETYKNDKKIGYAHVNTFKIRMKILNMVSL